MQTLDLVILSPEMRALSLFSSEREIRALPTSRNPRLLISGSTAKSRWQESAFYPAHRGVAKCFRFFLRLKVAAGLGLVAPIVNDGASIKDLIGDLFPDVDSVALLVGTPGPNQKNTIQIWSRERVVVGYIKYAETPIARSRLENEYRMLMNIPKGIGPSVLKFASFMEGKALVLSPIAGRAMPISLPPPFWIFNFVNRFQTSASVGVEEHPGVRFFQAQYGGVVMPWLESLSQRKWPIVVYHGDFAPWNILRLSKGNAAAIDWEYGLSESLPYLDLTHYVLQVGRLIRFWTPLKARAFAIKYLMGHGSLDRNEAEGLVRLSAYHVYREAIVDGHLESTNRVLWWRSVWECDK